MTRAHHLAPPRGLRARTAIAVALCASVACAATFGPARAEKVGVAAAVNPDAFSSLSGKPDKQLNIGKSIFYNERINTTTSGLVQVLLVDGSTFTVGPNSDLVIDKFVYDPRKKTGELLATFSKGTMRFIGGKLSKNEGGVKVKTPAGALAIRGGMFQGRVSGRKGTFSFLYGVSMTYRGTNGRSQTVYQPGYTLDLTGGAPTIRPTTPADTNFFQKAFSGGGTVVVGGQDNQPNRNPPPPLAETVSLQELISDATATQIDGELQRQENQNETPKPPDNTNDPNNEPPPTTEIRARVLTGPGTFTAFPGTDDKFTTHEGQRVGILGGDDNDAADASDFQRTFKIENNRLVGTVSGLTDSSEDGLENAPPVDVDFPATFDQCVGGVCLVTDATLTENGETENHVGRFVGRKNFFAYHIAQGEIGEQGFVINRDEPEPILAFGGTKHNFGTPSGRVHLFALTPDILQNAPAPFASAGSTPYGGFANTSVSPLALLEKDSNTESRSVWLQTSFYIGGDGSSQESFVNVALGGTSEDGGLIGVRRGGSHVDVKRCVECGTEREALAFTGDIATLAGPDGGHFLGTEQPNIVIGADSTGSKNIFNDIPLDPNDVDSESNSGATYHIGAGLGSIQPATQDGGTFQGYAVGMVQSETLGEVSNSGTFTNVVATESLDDFSLEFDPVTNTLNAGITIHDVQNNDGSVDSYTLGFGDDPKNPQNRSAYIDDQHYAAIESSVFGDYGADTNVDNARIDQVARFPDKPVTVINGTNPYQNASATSYFVSGEQLNVTAYFQDTFGPTNERGVGQAFCEGCEFMKWGAWGTRVAFGNEGGPSYVDNVHLGWWIASDVINDIDLPTTGEANYAGNAIGNVAALQNNAWKSYVATGKVDMSWNFGQRSGQFNISKFDKANVPGGLSFGGAISAPVNPVNGPNRFKGNLAGSDLTGGVRGSFVRGPGQVGPVPAGAIGNWNVRNSNSTYKAGGIWGASQPGRYP